MRRAPLSRYRNQKRHDIPELGNLTTWAPRAPGRVLPAQVPVAGKAGNAHISGGPLPTLDVKAGNLNCQRQRAADLLPLDPVPGHPPHGSELPRQCSVPGCLSGRGSTSLTACSLAGVRKLPVMVSCGGTRPRRHRASRRVCRSCLAVPLWRSGRHRTEPGESCDDRGALEEPGVVDESGCLAEGLAG